MIYDEKLSDLDSENDGKDSKDLTKYKCERWEKLIMNQELIQNIKFKENPILFLLIYCDSVQDDGRVTRSDDLVLEDLSEFKSMYFDKTSNNITVNLESSLEQKQKKETEIVRVAWCLKDNRFRIKIGDKLKTMDGNGGG